MINKKINTYKISPADGQALLSFKGRLNAEDLYMQLYDIDEENGELVNCKINEDKDGLVFNGDCLSVCAYLKAHDITVDLVYIDPPFASGANYSKSIHLRNKSKKDGIKSQAENSIGEEIMYGDIWKKEDYLNWIYTRLTAIREVMSENASIYVHLDWHIGAYVKVLLDEVFGEENFINEIIWSYTSGGAGNNCFSKKHDTIYLYSKSSDYLFNKQIGKRIVDKSKGYDPRVTYYKDEETGEDYRMNIMTDVWTDLGIISPNGFERTDYATQKPEDLLRRIIQTSSNEDMVVADFFGGSGVTAKVAHELKRKFITCDIGKNGVQTIRDRLKFVGASFEVIDIKDGLDLFRNPTQTIRKLFTLCSGEKRNSDSNYSQLWDGIIPYNKKMLYTKLIDNSKVLEENYLDYLITEISQDYINDGQDEYLLLYIYKKETIDQKYLDAKIKAEGFDFKVHLVPIEDLLKEKTEQINTKDSVNISIKKKGKKYTIEILNYFSPYLKKKIDDENLKRVSNKTKNQIVSSDNGYELIEMVSFDTKLDKKWTSNLEEKVDKNNQISGTYTLDTNKFKMKIRNIAGDELVISSEDYINEK